MSCLIRDIKFFHGKFYTSTCLGGPIYASSSILWGRSEEYPIFLPIKQHHIFLLSRNFYFPCFFYMLSKQALEIVSKVGVR